MTEDKDELKPEEITAEETDAVSEDVLGTETAESVADVIDAEFVAPDGTVIEEPPVETEGSDPEEETAEDEDAEPEAITVEATDEAESEPTATKPPKQKSANLRWDSMFLLLLTCVTLIRLGYLYIVPLDLGPDESYYWDWSRKLDLGYFSKPPMIAWVNALSTMLLGVSAQAIRMPAVVLGTVGLIGMYLCGRRMFSAEIAFWGVAAWLATPGAGALGLIMATDVLLVCCWCLALYTLWRCVEAPRAKLHWWVLTMLLVGLGSLSKQMMILFPVLMIIYLMISEDRRHLKQRWPWLLWGGSLLFLLPPLYWNFKHDWITFKHTAQHIGMVGTSILDHLKTFGEFIGGQMGLLTPITWVLLILLLLSLLPLLFKQPKQVRFLFVFGGIGLLGFSAFSFKQSINPNWPATFYPAGVLLLAAWGRGQVNAGFVDRLRKWFVPAIKLGVVLVVVGYMLPFVMQLSFIPLGKKDPTRRIKGWSELGQQVGETLQQQPRPEQTFVISPLRKYSSGVAFYAPGHPVTYQWSGNPPRVSSQYGLWPGPVDKLGWDALILHNADSQLPKELEAVFEQVVPLGERSIPIGAAGVRRYNMWRGENLLSWPE